MRTNNEIRHALMDRIQTRVEALNLNQIQAGNLCGVARNRFSEIKNHRSEFSVDALIGLLSRLGEDVKLEIILTRQTPGLPKLKGAR